MAGRRLFSAVQNRAPRFTTQIVLQPQSLTPLRESHGRRNSRAEKVALQNDAVDLAQCPQGLAMIECIRRKAYVFRTKGRIGDRQSWDRDIAYVGSATFGCAIAAYIERLRHIIKDVPNSEHLECANATDQVRNAAVSSRCTLAGIAVFDLGGMEDQFDVTGPLAAKRRYGPSPFRRMP
jgi:hypothetical protein